MSADDDEDDRTGHALYRLVRTVELALYAGIAAVLIKLLTELAETVATNGSP